MSELFFSTNYEQEFKWGKYHFRLGSVRPQNKKQISESLRDMSAESIRNRFLGSKRDFTAQELQYLTQFDGRNHFALGIEEREGMKRGVGVARLVRSSHDPHEAEIAITIIDEYQRKGLGIFLIELITLAALERNIRKLSFTFLAVNDGIIRLIHKAGPPYPGEHNRDYQQLFVDIGEENVEPIKTRWAMILPGIETFNC
jgi:RimJ/RimL family protein N-acetyltransferase